MLRLAVPQGCQTGTAAVTRDRRTMDALSFVQSARSLRIDYFTGLISRGLASLARDTGLAALFKACRQRLRRRRTITALSSLDDRLLNDIGIQRADIEATAAFCCDKPKVSSNARWHGLSAWASGEAERRRLNPDHKSSTAA